MYGLILLLTLGVVLSVGQYLTEYDLKTLQAIRLNRNLRVSPCTNFWAYSCGNWSSPFMDNFGSPEWHYSFYMSRVLSATVDATYTPGIVQKMRNYFSTCIDYEPKNLLLPPELRSSSFDWERAVAKYRKYGVNGVFFDESADVAYNDSERCVVQLKMPTIPADYSTQFARDLKALAVKYSTVGPEEEVPLRSWTLAELRQQIPQISWQNYFEELLEIELDELQLRVEVSDVEYLRAVGDLLQDTHITIVEEYLARRAASLANEAIPRKASSRDTIHGCVHHMRALFPLAMDYIYERYVQKIRTLNAPAVEEIFESLRFTFASYLHANRLQLSPTQFDFVRAKLRAMKLKISNLPDQTMPAEFYDTHYAHANFSTTDFQHNLWQALRLRTYLQHAPLRQHGAVLQVPHYYLNDDVFWARSAPFFEAERNMVTVPLIFLQFPFFDYRQQPIFRRSLLGFVLAHELSHAFDMDGIIFDAAGNESPIGLSIRKLETFQAALKCLLRTPTSSLKERTADVNGLQLAYDAFFGMRSYEYLNVKDQLFAFDSEFPAPKLFYLNFAQFFCGRLPLAIDHDMDNVRVNEAVQNLHQFAIEFQCQQELHLQSTDCEMWRPVSSHKK